jgi:hypothetical protein
MRPHRLDQRIRMLRCHGQCQVADLEDRIMLDGDVFDVHASSADIGEQTGQRSWGVWNRDDNFAVLDWSRAVLATNLASPGDTTLQLAS